MTFYDCCVKEIWQNKNFIVQYKPHVFIYMHV